MRKWSIALTTPVESMQSIQGEMLMIQLTTFVKACPSPVNLRQGAGKENFTLFRPIVPQSLHCQNVSGFNSKTRNFALRLTITSAVFDVLVKLTIHILP